jgi:hypothetical protein
VKASCSAHIYNPCTQEAEAVRLQPQASMALAKKDYVREREKKQINRNAEKTTTTKMTEKNHTKEIKENKCYMEK